MINGATHQLSSSLTQSLQGYRSDIDAMRAPEVIQPEASQSSVVSLSEMSDSNLNPDEPGKASQENHDMALKVVVQAIEIQNTTKMVDTHVDVASGSDNNEEIITSTIDSAETYHASMIYERRDDLNSVIETGQSQSGPDELTVASQDNRNATRKETMQAFEIEDKNTMVDTYVDPLSDNDEVVSTLLHNARINYARRVYMLSVFKRAALSESSGSKLSVVV